MAPGPVALAIPGGCQNANSIKLDIEEIYKDMKQFHYFVLENGVFKNKNVLLMLMYIGFITILNEYTHI